MTEPTPEVMPVVDTSTRDDDGPQPDQGAGFVEVEVADADAVEVPE